MRFVPVSLAIAPLALAITLAPARAAAIGYEEASGNAKGVIGGGLLGAELVLAIEAAADVQSPWLYLGGGLVGAAGGAVGGYFIEQESSARVSMILLAAGLTLAIPTTVAVLSATAYEPPATYLEDTPPSDEPVADPPQPAGAPASPPSAAPPALTPPATPPPAGTEPASGTPPTSKAPKRRVYKSARLAPLRPLPHALLDLSPSLLALSVPAVEIRDAYSRQELAIFGVEQTTEVHVPMLNVAF